ncbi:hypothetical protein CS542_01655 [Pedobacter sp. IW39]|nr:hypothetical protein CS542_01655 [Pedobacter sp. IW39]
MELNQVWTNLIDNAIDAMEPNQKGTLTLKQKRTENLLMSLLLMTAQAFLPTFSRVYLIPFYD